MENFQKRIEEIEAQFNDTDDKIRAELRGTQEALATAQERAKGLETSYRVALTKGSADATKLRVELTVAQDSVALLQEMAAQLEAELQTGELVEAQMRRHAAICAAVEGEGNHAIHEAVQAAQEAREQYKAALETLVQVQHRVALVGRQSYVKTAKTGRPVETPVLVRYSASEFPIPEPAESASAASFL